MDNTPFEKSKTVAYYKSRNNAIAFRELTIAGQYFLAFIHREQEKFYLADSDCPYTAEEVRTHLPEIASNPLFLAVEDELQWELHNHRIACQDGIEHEKHLNWIIQHT